MDWKETEELYTYNLYDRSRKLGTEYPDTLRSMADLASIYKK
jgi:hypothetical protein